MNKKLNEGDKVKFNERAKEELRGQTGIISKFLGIERINLAGLTQGKSVKYGLYNDVNMWEIQIDGSDELYKSPEDWLDKIA
jgi:hypothetical protein